MTDLRDWLRGNKLEQYADTFQANDIDLDILPDPPASMILNSSACRWGIAVDC